MEQEERMYQVPLEMICRHDRTAEVCRAAVEEDGWQLENVPEEVKTPELCRKALETEAGFGNDRIRLVQHIPSPEVCMEVLKECRKVCPEELYGVAASIRPEVMNGEMADFLLPLAVMLFRRTLREVAVAVAGLLLPALTLCYVNWAAGGEFLAQVAEPGSAFIAGTPLSLFLSTPVQNLVLPGAVFLLDLTALLFFLSDIYALGTKPRLKFIFNISALLLTAAALCGPAATPATVALAAVPSAVLLPFMFVRIHRAIALPLYLLLLASAVISAVLQ